MLRRHARCFFFISASLLAWTIAAPESFAGCTPGPTGGDDTLVCNAATPPEPTPGTIDLLAGDDNITVQSGSLNGGIDGNLGNDTIILLDGTVASVADAAGNNALILGPGGNPTITGNVDFGGGQDRLEVHSGLISGGVMQGGGIDTFIMTGGQIQSLNQGSGLDIAEMHGGRIVGLFFAGDFFTMTDGRIGEVDLEQANNEMRMSGGVIDGNVNAEQGSDLLELSGGSIGGMVDLGNGNNTIIVTDGSIGAGIVTGTGTDQLAWQGGGTIGGAINLGDGDDTATLTNLTSALLASTTSLSGDAGTDTLTFDNTEASGVSRFEQWETVDLTNGSELALDGALVLGDASTLTGALSIDATSSLLAGGGSFSVAPFDGVSLVTVTNAGAIDLTNGAAAATDQLTIFGNYVGNGGQLLLHTVLGADGSPSDTLVISGGTASGATGIVITNLGGAGAQTIADGILVVETINGATTDAGAFQLAAPVAAGAYEYLLFRGGAAPGTDDNWYLRSIAMGTPVPLFRPEVAVYAVLPQVARNLAGATLGTYHRRTGGQGGARSARHAWGRLIASRTEQDWSGTVDPSFDGHTVGFQAGQDLLSGALAPGHRHTAGVYVGYATSEGDVRGFALGQAGAGVGTVRQTGASLGAYWTHIGMSGWYTDTVLQATLFGGRAQSTRGAGLRPDGHGLAASLEGGYPLRIAPGVVLEPQAQAIWQHISLGDTHDAFSSVAFEDQHAFTGRIGARLYGASATGARWQPYLKVNLWHTFAGDDGVVFDAIDVIGTRRQATALEVGIGGPHSCRQASAFTATSVCSPTSTLRTSRTCPAGSGSSGPGSGRILDCTAGIGAGGAVRDHLCVLRLDGFAAQARYQHPDVPAIAAVLVTEQRDEVAFLQEDADQDVPRGWRARCARRPGRCRT